MTIRDTTSDRAVIATPGYTDPAGLDRATPLPHSFCTGRRRYRWSHRLMTDVPSLALILRNADPAKQGQVLGLNNATGALARFAGPLCAGLSFAHISINAPFVIAAMVVAPAILLALSAVGHHTASPRPSSSRPCP